MKKHYGHYSFQNIHVVFSPKIFNFLQNEETHMSNTSPKCFYKIKNEKRILGCMSKSNIQFLQIFNRHVIHRTFKEVCFLREGKNRTQFRLCTNACLVVLIKQIPKEIVVPPKMRSPWPLILLGHLILLIKIIILILY